MSSAERHPVNKQVLDNVRQQLLLSLLPASVSLSRPTCQHVHRNVTTGVSIIINLTNRRYTSRQDGKIHV